MARPNEITNYAKKPKFDEKKARLDSYLKLIVINGRPFEIVNDIGLVELAKSENNRLDLNVTIEKLKLHMNDRYLDMVCKIREIINKKYLTLKFDCATRHNRQFICISAQFAHNGLIQNICLDFIELFESHTAQNLSKTIMETLQNYKISKKYIIAATTDTASNMIATVRELNLNFDDLDVENPDDTPENNLFQNVNNSCPDIYHVKCCSHVYNLIVNDFLSLDNEIIGRARKVIKYLRRPNVINILKKMNMNLPPIDCITRYFLIKLNFFKINLRWSSTYIMLNYSKNNADNVKELISNLDLLFDDDWAELNLICSALAIPYDFTISSQKLQNSPGDIFLCWIDSKRRLLKLNTSYSSRLIECIESREHGVLANPGFLAGYYFDPRTKNLLTENQMNTAKEFIRSFFNE